jgi:hypothetical protein
VFVIDDFAPSGTIGDIAQWQRKADRLIRGQGNSSGRQRMRQDTSLRPVKPPRCLILSTGESAPRGHTVLARMLVIEVEKSDVNWEVVTRCQQAAATGEFAQVTAAFVRWLATNFEQRTEELQQQVVKYRERAVVPDQHKRTPYIVAQLAAGFNLFLDFATDQGAIDSARRKDLSERAWSAFFSLHVTDDALASNNLPSVVDLIKSILADDETSLNEFSKRLADAGYSPAHAEYYQRPLRILSEELYAVRPDFPRVTRATFHTGLPSAVQNISYSLAMGACAPWRIAIFPSDPGVISITQKLSPARIEIPAM